jgi:hypothetical protein
VVDEVERGEDHIKETFEDALEDGELPASVRTIVSSADQRSRPTTTTSAVSSTRCTKAGSPRLSGL